MERAIPIFPSKDLDVTISFYEAIGFALLGRHPAPHDYAILRSGNLELHLSLCTSMAPDQSLSAAYFRVDDVSVMYEQVRRLGLPSDGIPRLGAVADMPWGMREFHLVDPDGNLLRIGQMSTEG